MPSPRILVVDDSPSARTILQQQLLRLGVGLPDLRLAATIPEAMQCFAQWNPELVFVDLRLRGGDAPPPAPAGEKERGRGTADRLPQDGAELLLLLLGRNPALRGVVCSAAEPDHPGLRAHTAAGRVRVLVKPVVAAKVQEVLDSFRAADRRSGAT